MATSAKCGGAFVILGIDRQVLVYDVPGGFGAVQHSGEEHALDIGSRRR